jgi:hypothetical protein
MIDSSAEGTPSSVREWQYYNGLSEEDQKRWRDQKRAGTNVDTGDKVIRLDAGGKPEAEFPKNLAPADQPQNAAAKAEAIAKGTAAGESDNEKTKKAKGGVSGILANMRKDYKDLDALGGMVNTDKGAASNVAASLGASVIGQSYGKTVGSKEQSIRNKINGQIPALINSIRQATGMSAKAMDSNVELKFYLQQATDPKLDIQANLAAVDRIEEMFGLGKAVKISNGKETYTVSPEDAALAKAEGFEIIQ